MLESMYVCNLYYNIRSGIITGPQLVCYKFLLSVALCFTFVEQIDVCVVSYSV